MDAPTPTVLLAAALAASLAVAGAHADAVSPTTAGDGFATTDAAVVDAATFDDYVRMLEGILGVRFDAAGRAELRAAVDGYARDGDRVALAEVANAAAGWRLAASSPAELRAAALAMSRPDVLLGLQRAARAGRADARRLLERHHAAHPVLAPGHPEGLPLTRDMVEARLALEHFVAAEIHRRPAPAPDAAAVDRAVREAVVAHAGLTAEQQVMLARHPGEWQRTRWGWSRASALDRALARAELGATLTPAEQAAVEQYVAATNSQLAAMVGAHRDAMLGGTVRAYQQDSETIMGRGTVWNPATNRWEQQGGVVTEFDGRVRVP
jgi:hypothetical protein